MKYFFLILFLTLQSSAYFERGLSAAAGTNPKGANIKASLAYNYEVWSARTNESDFWKYGYLRPKVFFESSYYINTTAAELQIYPVAIFGGAIGTSYADRTVTSLDLLECDTVNCKGQLRKSYYNVNLNLGYGSLLAVLLYEKDYLQSSESDRPLVEYSSMLPIPEKNSELEKNIAFIGFKINEKMTMGFYESLYKIKDKKSEGLYLVANYKEEDFSYTLGAGTFGSDYYEKSFAAFVKISWILDPTLSLND